MTILARFVTTAALAGLAAAPAAAQYPYPYPQQYPQQYPQTYPGQPYPYGTQQGVIGGIFDQLLGRYAVSDRQAIRQCATAAMAQAQAQYRGNGYGGYGNQGYGGYGGGYGNARVTAITDVQRRSNGLRVSGQLNSGMYGGGYGGYGNQGYADPRYAAVGDLTFRCNVDYRGVVTMIRVRPNTDYRRY